MSNNINIFSIILIKDLNYIISKVQIHFLLYKTLCFKYNNNKSKCYFNFFKLNIEKTYIDKIGFIFYWHNNV